MPRELGQPSTVRRTLIWGAALVPILAFTYLYHAHRIPPAVVESSINLLGTWKVISGEVKNGAAPELDDRFAPDLRIPGNYVDQGFAERHVWLRRHFTVQPAALAEPWFVVIDDLFGTTGQVYVNGVRFGRLGGAPGGSKTDIDSRNGIAVPAAVLHEGDNVFAIDLTWGYRNLVAVKPMLRPQAALIGPDRLLGHHFVQVSDLRRKMQYGAGALMIFLIVLFGFLAALEWRTASRPLYLACVTQLLAATLYLEAMSGLFVPIASGVLIGCAMVGLAYAQPDFLLLYLGGARSPYRRVNAVICTLLLVATVGLHLLGLDDLTFVPVIATGVYALVQMSVLVYLTGVRVLRRYHELDPILIGALSCTVFTASADILRDNNVIDGPRMYSLGIATSTIMVAIVLIADFMKISFDNKALSSSLKVSNAELADALIKAEEASRLKSEFVANVSHELRTPLNSVINIPEGLLEGFKPFPGAHCSACDRLFELDEGESLSPGMQCPECGAQGTMQPKSSYRIEADPSVMMNGISQVHRSGNHLLRLINDVLDFSKLEAGHMTLVLESIDVASLLDDVVATLQPLADKRRIRLRPDTPSERPTLRADVVKLSQIFINLIGNAIKFSPEGAEVVIEARTAGGFWRFAVRDQGIGIAAENHAVVFESFRQVDGSNTRKFGGTGLGLSITRKLAEAHGGRVWLESALGKGSTFFVEVPIDGKNDAAVIHVDQALRGNQGQRTILILDDDRFAVENLKVALRPLQHHVHGITEPAELDNALATLEPDLLILDILMPKISGLEVLRALRARPDAPPVLVSSAHHGNIDVVRALGGEWLAKPWRSDELHATVDRLLLQAVLKERGAVKRLAS